MNVTKTETFTVYRRKTSGYQWGRKRGVGQDWDMGLRDTNYDTQNT